MKKTLCMIAILGLATSAMAATVTYGWEDGGTILGSYGNLADPTNVSGIQSGLTGDVAPGTWSTTGPHGGSSYLHVAEDPHSSTPQAYVAWITGLEDGDVVDGSFWGWDDLDGTESSYGAPALRIWGHYATSSSPDYVASAGGSSTYSEATVDGWQELSHSWEFDSDGGARDALVIEVRLYSYGYTSDSRTDYWVDDLTVTAPESATIIVAPEPASLMLLCLAGLLIRRR